MRPQRDWMTLACVFACALLAIGAKPKQEFKPVRPMGIPDSPDASKNQSTLDATASYSKVAPTTKAASVMVIDARSGEILYEKNADAPRAAASTQKLLTALVVAERGGLDSTVVVQPVDTLAEPVKLNIKAGETYTRIELLRALLVKS